MEKILRSFADWFTSQINFVVTSFFVFGITPVILYRNGFIPGSELILAAFWITAVMSPLVTALTLLRWLTKWPTPLTWLQAAFGVVSVITLIYSYTALKIIYEGETGMPGSTVAILGAVVAIITVFAIYLSQKAIKNRFKN